MAKRTNAKKSKRKAASRRTAKRSTRKASSRKSAKRTKRKAASRKSAKRTKRSTRKSAKKRSAKSSTRKASSLSNRKSHWAVYRDLQKRVDYAWNKLKTDVKRQAPPNIIMQDRQNLFLLLGEVNYMAGEYERMAAG